MASKETFTFGHQGGHPEVSEAPGSVHPATVLPVSSETRSLPLGRFLLSSTGFHLILVWIAISVGLPKAPSAPQPLVVTIIRSTGSESTAGSGPLTRTRASQPAAPAGRKQIAQPRPAPPAPQESHHEEAQEGGARPLPMAEAIEPKAVGLSAGGSGAGSVNPAVAVAASGLSSGPVLLGPDGDGTVGSSSASRGGAGRLDASLAAPATPSVTIGAPHGGTGRGGGWATNGTNGGGNAAPNYGINPLPKYPLVAREKGYEGTVYLRVLVRIDGRVGQLAVDRTSGHDILDRAAVDSVREWAFFPAKKSGKLVESWVLLPVKFALN